MQIEAGKRYWRRDGGISAIIKKNNHSGIYSWDGLLIQGETCDADLVAEYVGPELVMPIMEWKEGKRYVHKSGIITTPMSAELVDRIECDNGAIYCKDRIEREYRGRKDQINKEG